MLEVRFGLREHITYNKGFSQDAVKKGGLVSFSMTPEQLRYWAKQAEKYNKALEFNIQVRNDYY